MCAAIEANAYNLCVINIAQKTEGILIHYFNSEDRDNKQSKKQLKSFYKTLRLFKENNILINYIYLANSADIYFHDNSSNMASAGLSIYGLSPANKQLDISPIMTSPPLPNNKY